MCTVFLCFFPWPPCVHCIPSQNKTNREKKATRYRASERRCAACLSLIIIKVRWPQTCEESSEAHQRENTNQSRNRDRGGGGDGRTQNQDVRIKEKRKERKCRGNGGIMDIHGYFHNRPVSPTRGGYNSTRPRDRRKQMQKEENPARKCKSNEQTS